AKNMLSDHTMALRKFTSPAGWGTRLIGGAVQFDEGIHSSFWASGTTVSGVMTPSSRAMAAVKGLNTDPGGYRLCMHLFTRGWLGSWDIAFHKEGDTPTGNTLGSKEG